MSTLKEIANLIKDEKFDKILVVCHRNPDGDAVGSAWALAYALRKAGKAARAFSSDEPSADFSHITSVCQGEPFDFGKIITVDVASCEMVGNDDIASRADIVIDHHLKNTVPAKCAKFVSPEAASSCEIVTALIREMEIEFDAFLASALYTGVMTDTGCFRYSNTDKDTFMCAAFLSQYAAEGDFYAITKKLFETKTRKRIKTEAFAAENCRYLCGGKAAFVIFGLETQKTLGVTYEELDSAVNVIRQTEGVLVSAVAKEKEKGSFRVSVRSEGGVDASAFCGRFGGGGHFAAAGCTVSGDEESVTETLISAIEEIFS